MVALNVGLAKYGWEAHDGRQYGRQELFDGNMHLTTSLTKRFCQVHISATSISGTCTCTRPFVGNLHLESRPYFRTGKVVRS